MSYVTVNRVGDASVVYHRRGTSRVWQLWRIDKWTPIRVLLAGMVLRDAFRLVNFVDSP